MLLNNWGGIDHQIIYFHEYVNLFSGKSGSGKSTVMDAMQMVLYGSVRNDFLNKAADDTKNKRSVMSYLRGAQKDGSANRENQDFHSQVILEILDTGTQNRVCVGAVFEVSRNDAELKKYSFFSHVGGFPEDEYLEEGIPYSYKKMQKLIQERSTSEENIARVNLNRMYPSQEAYITTLNEVIFGYVDAGRFKTMEKSAIALRMTNGTGQFIKDYMFPKSKEDTISAISDQLAAYRDIKEQVEQLESRIEMLEQVKVHDIALQNARTGQETSETLLKILDVEDKKTHLSVREEEFFGVTEKIKHIDAQTENLKLVLQQKREELAKIQAELKASECERKRERLEQLNELIQKFAQDASDWRKLVKELKRWEETEDVCDYVSNPTLQALMDICEGNISQEKLEKLKKGLKDAFEYVKEEADEIRSLKNAVQKDYQEKKEFLDDLKSDKKHYKKELKEAKRKLQDALSLRYGRTIHVEVLADLFDVTDEAWRNAVEGRLGRVKFALVTEPRYALEAAEIFRTMKKQEYESVDLINTAAIERDKPQAENGTLYDTVKTESDYVDACLRRYLGRIFKCDTVEQLHEVKDGVTKDCYSYSNYIFRHLRQEDYKYPSIGQKISPKQIRDLEDEIEKLKEKLITFQQGLASLNQVNDLERLQAYDYEKVLRLAQSGQKLASYNKEAVKLQEEISELEKGTFIAELKKQETTLKEQIDNTENQKESLHKEILAQTERKGKLEDEIEKLKDMLARLTEGFEPKEELCRQVTEVLETGKAAAFKKEHLERVTVLKALEEKEEQARVDARMTFIRTFPSYDFNAMEKDNTRYDELLEKCKLDFEPKYKAEFENQYMLVYQMLRDNVIAAIHGEIKAAKRHRREINSMLSEIRFSDSIYQIDILPTDDENRQFYDMLTAEELDMKVSDMDMDGQISFGEDAFYQKYEAQINRLTEKFMPPKTQDPNEKAGYKLNMEKYADYRTYLKFSMYEQAVDADGNIRKNYVDDMAGRDSGGEGQNPKYVALFAGFAMLYKQQSNRESKIRLVLLDEAFSKMDKERSEVCLHYARQLGLQLIVCVPDERLQSLVRNVDCVYALRRANNRISMIHIDKGNYFQMMEGNADDHTDAMADQ